jgi:uncharacterized protein (TIGR00369 family)
MTHPDSLSIPPGQHAGDLPLPIPFIESMGVHLLEMADGRALATMIPRAEHMNSWSVVHGGVMMTLLDFVMSMASRSMRDDLAGDTAAAGGSLTVEMKTTFIRPGTGVMTIKGQCVHAGRSLSFCEGEITDAQGKTLARASGTFKFWSRR